MEDVKNYLVTASHVIPKYGCNDLPARVSRDSYTGQWSATMRGFGCSKGYRTPEIAITEMLRDHACTDIRIRQA